MMIRIDDSPPALLELLWIREAWGLASHGDQPPRLNTRPESETTPPEKWAELWPRLWSECLDHAVSGSDPRAIQRLLSTADGSPERATLLADIAGPSVQQAFGSAAFTTSFDAWLDQHHHEVNRRNAIPVDATPERLAIDALIPAWKNGLNRVITIPCVDTYTRIFEPETLLITDDTRQHPGKYAEALHRFSAGSRAG
ncbi:hypothetical protein [Mycetocola spongiae]|uniref:hypothetical protein n=1 Tax=Mycetocola spongiae TaxID=2859226 RepID=UPI001CF23FC8|nr:hypothetical protein [Mycetocola spongiae]UCR88816.1 hypothetical protein KXZ72_12810 [Mycetocola spongiae]